MWLGGVWQGACVVGRACMAVGHAWQWGHELQGGVCGGGACVAVGCMHGRGACVAGGCAWQGDMRGKGACMAGGHAWHTVNERAVRILLECILVSILLHTFFQLVKF